MRLRRLGLDELAQLEVGDGRDGDGVAAGQNRKRVEQRLGRRIVEHVGQDEHERVLRPLDPVERARVVAVDRRRLEVEERAHDRVGAATTRAEGAQEVACEGERAAAVAELLGDGGDRNRGVDRGVESRARARRRRHQASTVDNADDVAIALDAKLVAHRPAQSGGGAPVHMADVVVRQVVAHGLELGAEAERTSPAPLIAQPAPANRGGEPTRARQIGIHDQLGRLTRAVCPGAEAKRAGDTARGCGQHVAPSPPRHQRGSERPVRLSRLDLDVGRARLPQPNLVDRCGVESQLGGNAADNDPRQ